MQTMTPGTAQRMEQTYAGYKNKEAPITPWKKPNRSYKVLDGRIEKFDRMLQRFVEYVKKYKREPESSDHDDEQIYNWVQSVRRKKRQGDLLPLFEDKLNNIQFVWEKPPVHVSPFLYKVERKIKSAIPFQRNHATFRWLAREVMRYNNNTMLPTSRIKFERILQINQATVLEGGTVSEVWNKNYKIVVRYKKDERNQSLRELFNQKPSLEVWMNLLNLHKKLGVLNEEWVQKLADMEFHQVNNKSSVEMTDQKWKKYILEIKKDIETNGKPVKISELRTYRKYKRLQNAYDGFASPEQKAMFDILEINPSKKKNWDERYDDLKKFVAENGCMPTSKKDCNLYQWLQSTIRYASANKLSPEKYQRLKDLGVQFRQVS